MEKMESVVVGLIAGRHSLPVSEFIFAGEIQDVLDFRSLAKTIDRFLADRVGVSVVSGCGVNQDDYTDVRVCVAVVTWWFTSPVLPQSPPSWWLLVPVTGLT